MIEAREAVANTVEVGKAYLECREPEPFVHNTMVGRLERAAKQFNRERERFLEKHEGPVASQRQPNFRQSPRRTGTG